MLEIEVTNIFVGPREELDKLAAVNWDMVSSVDASSEDAPTHYYKANRVSDSILEVHSIYMEPAFDQNEVCG